MINECPKCKSKNIYYIDNQLIHQTKRYKIVDGKLDRSTLETEFDNKEMKKITCYDCSWYKKIN